MRRSPWRFERALVHQTLNSDHPQRIALRRENFDFAILGWLHQSLPYVPWLAGWEVDRDDLLPFFNPKSDEPTRGPEEMFDFRVKITGKVASRNRVKTEGGTIYLQTTLLAAGRKLFPEEALNLEHLEQYTTVVTLERPSWL